MNCGAGAVGGGFRRGLWAGHSQDVTMSHKNDDPVLRSIVHQKSMVVSQKAFHGHGKFLHLFSFNLADNRVT